VTEDVPFSNRADVVAVLDQLGVAKACLVGNSRGGHIALDTAVEYPDRVAAVVLLGSNIGGYEPEATPEEAEAFAAMDRLEADLKERGDREASADFMVRLWVDGIGQPEGRAPAAVREAVRAMALEVSDPTRRHGKPIPLDPAAATSLAELRMPILALAGALDVSDIPATARHIAATAPNARAIVIPGVAHMIAMEVPEQVATLIAELVAPLGSFG
jgi:pimeloyl-ACP methyl ester carboxylesterase